MKNEAVIRAEHVYRHPPPVVWKALTEPTLHARWFAAGDVRPVVGHRFELDMGKWGKQPCEVTEVIPERRLRYQFSTGGLNTTLTWELTAVEGGTLLQLTHEGFDVESPMGRQALEGMKPGWPRMLERLSRMLDEELP
jgi:uncharacterized protein YndB with AHSA1/START domain